MARKLEITFEKYMEGHIASHLLGESCLNCSPEYRGCCEKCWQKNRVYSTSRDYCKDFDKICPCHK